MTARDRLLDAVAALAEHWRGRNWNAEERGYALIEAVVSAYDQAANRTGETTTEWGVLTGALGGPVAYRTEEQAQLGLELLVSRHPGARLVRREVGPWVAVIGDE